MNNYFVYIVTNKRNGTLYIGVTNNLKLRMWQHKNKILDGFTFKYDLNILVYYEVHEDIKSAITREKQLKKWKRLWKLRIIEEMNANWKDLNKNL